MNTWALRPVRRAVVSAAGPLAALAVLVLLLATNSRCGGAVAASPALYAALAVSGTFLQLTASVLTLLPIPGHRRMGYRSNVTPPQGMAEFGARVGGIAPALLFLSLLARSRHGTQMFWNASSHNLCKMTGLGADFATKGLLLFHPGASSPLYGIPIPGL